MVFFRQTWRGEEKQNKPTVLPRFTTIKKRKIEVDLAYNIHFSFRLRLYEKISHLVVKSIAAVNRSFACAKLFAKIRSQDFKRKLFASLFCHMAKKKIIMFLLTVQQNIQIFPFFLLYLECVFQRENRKKINEDDLTKKNQVYHKIKKN